MILRESSGGKVFPLKNTLTWPWFSWKNIDLRVVFEKKNALAFPSHIPDTHFFVNLCWFYGKECKKIILGNYHGKLRTFPNKCVKSSIILGNIFRQFQGISWQGIVKAIRGNIAPKQKHHRINHRIDTLKDFKPFLFNSILTLYI